RTTQVGSGRFALRCAHSWLGAEGLHTSARRSDCDKANTCRGGGLVRWTSEGGYMDSERECSSPAAATTSVVTGAFGFSGQQIAKRLLLRGDKVRTLTNHPQPGSPLFGSVQVSPLDLGNTEQLAKSMRGASVLYNTYWVRFSYGDLSHERAVQNTKALIRAAEAAGVKRIVHVSITNPSS